MLPVRVKCSCHTGDAQPGPGVLQEKANREVNRPMYKPRHGHSSWQLRHLSTWKLSVKQRTKIPRCCLITRVKTRGSTLKWRWLLLSARFNPNTKLCYKNTPHTIREALTAPGNWLYIKKKLEHFLVTNYLASVSAWSTPCSHWQGLPLFLQIMLQTFTAV